MSAAIKGALIANAAKQYVVMRRRLLDATNATMAACSIEVDLWLHELTLLVGEPCGCEDGTCPGLSFDDEDEPVETMEL